jgi:formylglycine-generating enzyme required for sulfatase activity
MFSCRKRFVCIGIIAISAMSFAGSLSSADMANIPAGCFDMGDAFNEGGPAESPGHKVCISAFEMDIHQVTNAQYKKCVDAGACSLPHRLDSYSRESYYGNTAYNDYPVIRVDWNGANTYCTWVGKRLPTEAEWEYAARGGITNKRYPWGDTINGSDGNYKIYGDPEAIDTNRVGSYSANGYGLYNIVGNAWEWVNDWYSSDYYQYCLDHRIVNNPPGPASGRSRVLRGGPWFFSPCYLRVASRNGYIPTDAHRGIFGFRCAR